MCGQMVLAVAGSDPARIHDVGLTVTGSRGLNPVAGPVLERRQGVRLPKSRKTWEVFRADLTGVLGSVNECVPPETDGPELIVR